MNTSQVFSFSNAAYDKLRTVTELWLPAIGAFYATIAFIWGFGYVEQVLGTITALVTLLGVLLGLSRKQYGKNGYDGAITFDGENGLANLHADADKLIDASKPIVLQVIHPNSQR